MRLQQSNAMNNKNLKYLFEAEFFDGKPVYKQNKQDASVKFPPTPDEKGELQGKSCMSDIQEDIDNFNVKKFTLIEQAMLGKKISVDLENGYFEVDSSPFSVEGERPLPVQPNRFKLIYFRVVRQNHCTPARYMNPLDAQKIGQGIEVTNSKGEKHYYEKVERAWKEEKEEIIDGNRQKVMYYYVLPTPPLSPLLYMIGWQVVIAGKTYTQKILVQ